jgi:DNA-directed RNA polymerase subunit RPC12/RpoP
MSVNCPQTTSSLKALVYMKLTIYKCLDCGDKALTVNEKVVNYCLNCGSVNLRVDKDELVCRATDLNQYSI